MARWDKFLNEASRGYGLGFHRYQLYDEARRERQNRADAQAAMDAYGNATAAPETQWSQDQGQFQGTQWGPGQSVAQVRGAQTALPTGAVQGDAMPRSRALEADEIPSAVAGNDAYPIGGLAKDITDRTMEDYGKGPTIRPEEPDNYIMRKGEDGKVPDLPKKAVLIDESKADKGKEVEQVFGEIIPTKYRKAVGAVTTGGGSELTGDGSVRMEHWDTMRNKLAAIYARNGDIEGMLSLDSRIDAMQQERMLSGLEEAIRLVGVDPKAAAVSLYKAYSYFPDGVNVKIAIKDGQLVGYGYDEQTGDFRGRMPLDEQSLSRLYESMKDPAAFQATKRAEQTAAEERAYDRAQDKREYLLKVFEAESTAALNASKMLENKYDALKTYGEFMGWDATSAMGFDSVDDLHKYNKDVTTAIGDMISGEQGQMTKTEMEIWGNDGAIGGSRARRFAQSIAKNVNPSAGYVAPRSVVDISNKLLEIEYLRSGVVGEKAAQDRLAEIMGAGNIILRQSGKPGHIDAVVDGEVVTFPAAQDPGIAGIVFPAAEKTAATTTGGQAVPTTPLPPYTEQTAGQRIGTAVKAGLVTPVADAAQFVGDVGKAAYGHTKEFAGDVYEGVRGAQ